MEYTTLERWALRIGRKAGSAGRLPAYVLLACALALAGLGLAQRSVEAVAPALFLALAGMMVLERRAFGGVIRRLEAENAQLRRGSRA